MYSLRKRLSLLAILATSSLCTSNYAFSQIWIEERQRAELPKTLVTGARQKIVLTYSNQLGNGTTADIVGGQTMSGHYYISSDTQQTISINILSNRDVASIQLKSFKLKYKGETYNNFPAVGLPSPGNGEDVYIGFTAVLESSAVEGEILPSYLLDINEE